MEIILKERVENLGKLGDKVSVKPGYARNYLLPQRKAVMATKENIAAFEKQKAELERREQERLQHARAQAEKIEGKTIRIGAHAGEQGKLFGSVGTREVSEALAQEGVSVQKRQVRMPEGPIRLVGEYTLGVHLYTGIDVELHISVQPE